MKYIILQQGFGEGCDYTIGCNQTWELVDFDGDLPQAVLRYKNKALYGGDEEGKPENYRKIKDMEGQIEKLLIFRAEGFFEVDMDLARKEHNMWWENKDKQESEDDEREEYLRLKEKFKD